VHAWVLAVAPGLRPGRDLVAQDPADQLGPRCPRVGVVPLDHRDFVCVVCVVCVGITSSRGGRPLSTSDYFFYFFLRIQSSSCFSYQSSEPLQIEPQRIDSA
jgi:hypothetical protein